MNDQLRVLLADKGVKVESIEPTASVKEAVQKMTERGIGALLVMTASNPVGIFTERDALRRVLARGLDPAKTSVADVMTRELVVVDPKVTVGDAMAIITSRRFRHLPVLEDGRIIGIVSSGDLTRWVSRYREGEVQQLIQFITGQYPA
jgi:CBS domain-containing protein